MASSPDEVEGMPLACRGAYRAMATHAPPRVLVADDDPVLRELIATAMRDDGYEVVEAETGGKLLVVLARQIARPQGPDLVDLVVSDVRMPVCTGSQILEQLRTASWRTPFVLMTAFGDSGLRARVERLGGVLFDKPFEMEDLRAAVRYLLRRANPTA